MSRRLIALFLVLMVTCVLFRGSVIPLSQHFTAQNVLEHGHIDYSVSLKYFGDAHMSIIHRPSYVNRSEFHRNEDRLQHDPVTKGQEEHDYYKLRSVKTDHCNFASLVESFYICNEQVPFLLILVPSLPHHMYNRQIIRETWGQFVKNKTLRYKNIPGPRAVKLVFLLGRWVNERVRQIITQEQKKHGDIVVGYFEDSYKNLTRKILFGLKWMTMFCGKAEYILKVDVDVYVNVPKLLETLTENPANVTGSIYGHLHVNGRVERQGSWAVSTVEFPLSKYPPYMSGNSYVVPGATAPKLLNISQYLPYHPIEDAFNTGILPRMSKISQFHVEGFTSWRDASPSPCTFFSKNKISGNKVNPDLMRKMWLTENNFHLLCFNKSHHLARLGLNS